MLKLMYITKDPEIATIAEECGVDWIFVDMEHIGKEARQRELNTVKNHHTVEDVRKVKSSLSRSSLIVRINPIQKIIGGYSATKAEIDATIEAGADILMLPFFHTVNEVEEFIGYVNGRAQTCLLLETPEAVQLLDELLEVPGIDYIHIGLNDLHLAMNLKFMFQLLANGYIDSIADKIKQKGIPFGFGGLATLYGGCLPGNLVLKEHYRVGSSMVILGRSFCNSSMITSKDEIRNIFYSGIEEIRALETKIQKVGVNFEENRIKVVELVDKIVQNKNYTL